jgi:CheY-like chemotaxis protein
VSAALRAAIDWLCESESDRRVRLRTEDSALEVMCRRVDPAGLIAASKVLGAIGANLGPVTADRAHGPWIVRAPIATTRETYLMLSQGGLSLALPWHSVLKIAMLPRAAFESRVRHLPHPVIEPFEPLSVAVPEYPVVLVGHGLKRAYLLADRLVWRLPAESIAAPPDPQVFGHERCVRTEDGAVYRVLESGRLLDNVEPVTFDLGERLAPNAREALAEAPPSHAAVEVAAAIDLRPNPEAVVETPVPDADTMPLTVSDMTLVTDAAPFPVVDTTPGLEEHPAPEPIDPGRVAPMPLRALLAEDSLSARLALAAMIETHGIEAHAVRDAASLFAALENGPWALVCVDTELPDARGPELLRRVAEQLSVVGAESEIVALVRDGEERTAAEGGVARTLRKPWSRTALEQLLVDLGLGDPA